VPLPTPEGPQMTIGVRMPDRSICNSSNSVVTYQI
jgi:hypothetical protein